MYNKKILKTRIKSYEAKINRNFHDNEMAMGGPWAWKIVDWVLKKLLKNMVKRFTVKDWF